jgi:hypothetical protein
MHRRGNCCCRDNWWCGARPGRHDGLIRGGGEAGLDALGNPALETAFGLQLELVSGLVADRVGKPPVFLLADAAQCRIVQVLDGG